MFDKLSLELKILLKNSFWVLTANITRIVFLFLKSILITSMLGPKNYGSFLSILAIVAIIQSFVNTNFGTALIKFGSEYKVREEKQNIFKLWQIGIKYSIASWILSILLIFLVLFTTKWFLHKEIDLEIQTLLITLCYGVTFIDYLFESKLRLFNKFKELAVNNFITTLLDFSLFLVLYLFFKPDLTYFLFAICGIRLINSLLYNLLNWYIINKEFKKNEIVEEANKINIKEINKFLFSNYGGRLLKNIIEQSDVLLIGYFSNQNQVGLYGVGKRLGYAILGIVDPLINAIFPQLSKLIAEKKFESLKVMLLQYSKIVIIPFIIVFILSFIFRIEIVTLFFGQEFINSSEVFYLVILAALVASLTFWNVPLLISLNEVNFRVILNFGILLILILFSIFLIPSYGAFGAAITLLVIKCCESFFGSFWGLKKLNKMTIYE